MSQSLLFGSAGLAYSALFGLSCLLLAGGAGHGISQPLNLFCGPVGLGLIMWPAIGALWPFRERFVPFFCIVMLLSVHIASVAASQDAASLFRQLSYMMRHRAHVGSSTAAIVLVAAIVELAVCGALFSSAIRGALKKRGV